MIFGRRLWRLLVRVVAVVTVPGPRSGERAAEGCFMAVDYDAPRVREGESEVDSLQEVQEVAGSSKKNQQPNVDVDENEAGESFELPGADLSGMELEVEVRPQQADEFTCTVCFLVHHRAALASIAGRPQVCRDCA